MTIISEKQTCRRRAFEIRKKAAKADLSKNVRAGDALVTVLNTKLTQLSIAPNAPKTSIGFYMAAGSEIDTMPLMKHLAHLGHGLCLPVCEEEMVFHHYQIDTILISGANGILQPDPSTAPICQPEVVFVPLLAFDADGTRLGRGGGHYDRWLENGRKTHKLSAIGLAFDEQLFADLPFEAHDEKLDAILTPSGVIYPSCDPPHVTRLMCPLM